jgi:hypothetical protein
VPGHVVSRWPWHMTRPRMTMRAGAPQAQTLEALAQGLDDAGYRITDRDSAGFRAGRRAWWLLLLQQDVWPERTALTVRAQDGQVSVSAENGFGIANGSRAAARGLNAGATELRRLGFSVEAGPWTRRG